MTKDFRNVGRISSSPPPTISPTPSLPAAQAQSVVLGALYFAAVGFFLAGLWLATGGSSPFPAEVSEILGVAFMIAGVSDIVAVQVIKRAWLKRASHQ